MGSPTKHTETVRARKRLTSGKKRKTENEIKGTSKSQKELFKVVK